MNVYIYNYIHTYTVIYTCMYIYVYIYISIYAYVDNVNLKLKNMVLENMNTCPCLSDFIKSSPIVGLI